MRTTSIRAAAAVLGLFVLTSCGSNSNGNGNDTASGGGSSSSSESSADAVLKTADSDLGDIVVDAQGRTVYVFDKDTAGDGKSVCSGDCLAKWPAVTADSDKPAVDGVTGDVGTITRDDGSTQVTLGGMPLYLHTGDSQAGDVTGQAVGGSWWVVGPDGTKISAAAASEQSTGSGY